MERVPDVLIEEFIKRSRFRDVKRLCSTNKKFRYICNHEPIRNIIDALEINQSMSNEELKMAVRDYFSVGGRRLAIFRQYGAIGEWNVSNVTDMEKLFYGRHEFNEPLNEWNVSNVTNMSQMFWVADSFNQPLNDWDVSNVADMSGVFWFAGSFNQPLNWNVSNANTSVESIYGFGYF